MIKESYWQIINSNRCLVLSKEFYKKCDKYKTKKRRKSMWVKGEKSGNLYNMNKFTEISVCEHQGMYIVAGGGYHDYAIKSFKYKQDAEKFLDELLEKINDSN
jgi:hypothetical protein